MQYRVLKLVFKSAASGQSGTELVDLSIDVDHCDLNVIVFIFIRHLYREIK